MSIKNILLLAIAFIFIQINAQEYRLVWEENFNSSNLNELQHWTIEVDGNGGGNQELQYYRRENIAIEAIDNNNNALVISAKRENFAGRPATSGRLVTRNKVAIKYGKIEARIKLPSTANGLWPAFWMMGEDFTTVGWPRCGEIDILEMGNVNGINRGTQDRYFNGACHWGESHVYFAQDFTASYSLQNDYHLYTLIWDEQAIKMYLDLDKFPNNPPYFQMNISGPRTVGQAAYYFHKPFHVLLNLAVGGTFTGITGFSNIDKVTALKADGTPAKMYVDYLRFYQKGVAGEEFYGPSMIVDTEKPTAFSATKGAVTSNSVDFVLQATDNSGFVNYEISFNNTKSNLRVASGVSTTHTVGGLSPNTNYTFSIRAFDGNGNEADNNPIVISAQTLPAPPIAIIDFETVGNNWTWTMFSNGNNDPSLYSTTSNPNKSGINSSNNVAKLTVNSNAARWAGMWSDNMQAITLSADNCIVKVHVYKNVVSNFGIKLEGAGGVEIEKLTPNTKTNEWEELRFDFSDHIGSRVTRLVVLPDFPAVRTAGSINHWDNISFNSLNPNATETIIANKVEIAPNPFIENIKIKSESEILSINIYNIAGQKVFSENIGNTNAHIALSQIKSGSYLLEITHKNGSKASHKIIKL